MYTHAHTRVWFLSSNGGEVGFGPNVIVAADNTSGTYQNKIVELIVLHETRGDSRVARP